MKHFQKIGEYPVDVLAAQLEQHPELWDACTQRKARQGSPHTGMQDIWVRYNEGDPYSPTFNDRHVPVWYPAWKVLPALKPIVFDLMRKVDGEMLGGVLITKISPGSGIDPHADDGWHVQYYDKFYVSIRSEPGAMFFCQHEDTLECLEPQVGECWLFDNRKRHWVENQSTSDRITLIVCIRTEMFGRC